MFVKFVTFSLVLLMLSFTSVQTTFAADKKEEKRAKRAIKVEKGVRDLGVSKDSKVKVKMWDKSKVKSKGAWIAIGFGIGAVIFGILLYAVVTSGRWPSEDLLVNGAARGIRTSGLLD